MKTKKLVFFSLMCLVSMMMSCGGDDAESENNSGTPNTSSSQTGKRYGGLGVMLSKAPG